MRNLLLTILTLLTFNLQVQAGDHSIIEDERNPFQGMKKIIELSETSPWDDFRKLFANKLEAQTLLYNYKALGTQVKFNQGTSLHLFQTCLDDNEENLESIDKLCVNDPSSRTDFFCKKEYLKTPVGEIPLEEEIPFSKQQPFRKTNQGSFSSPFQQTHLAPTSEAETPPTESFKKQYQVPKCSEVRKKRPSLDPTTFQCSNYRRAMCTMEYRPATCEVVKSGVTEYSSYGSNECHAKNAVLYHACIAGEDMSEITVVCKPTRRGPGTFPEIR